MRIIAGTYGGRVLRSGANERLRPTADRVKESIFNILTNIVDFDGFAILDLFAGSGSLGLEALSRGARRIVFVDHSYKAVQTIQHNIDLLRCIDKCSIHEIDVSRFLDNVDEQFDVVFADPPYNFRPLEDSASKIFLSKSLQPAGIAVIEHSSKVTLSADPSFAIYKHRVFGDTAVTFLEHSKVE
jgi:16S rRNA (guanine966-N2)-methyltransferase